MAFSAEISAIRTRPYTSDELRDMSSQEKGRIEILHEEKVLGEDQIETVTAGNPDDLRTKILVVLDRLHPIPIIVKTDAYPDSFLVGRQCHHSDPKGIFESVAFKYNPEHPSEINRKRRELEQLNQINQPPKVVEPDFQKKPFDEAEEKALFEKQMDESHNAMAKAMGLGSYTDFINFMKNSIEEHLSPNRDNLQEAIEKGQRKLMAQYYAHGGYGAHTRLENPKEVFKDTTILFRVVGKDSRIRANHMRYYSKLHDIRAAGTSNEIHD